MYIHAGLAGRQQQMAGCENEEGKTKIDSQENCVLVLLFLFHDALALALSLFHSLLDSPFHVLWVHVFQHPVELPVQADAELLHETFSHDPKFVKVLVWRGDSNSSSCCSSNVGSLQKWLRWGWMSGN